MPTCFSYQTWLKDVANVKTDLCSVEPEGFHSKIPLSSPTSFLRSFSEQFWYVRSSASHFDIILLRLLPTFEYSSYSCLYCSRNFWPFSVSSNPKLLDCKRALLTASPKYFFRSS